MTAPSAPRPGLGDHEQPGLPARPSPSRRAVLRTSAIGGVALASLRAFGRAGAGSRQSPDPVQQARPGPENAPLGLPGMPTVLSSATAMPQPARSYQFNQNWLFGGVYVSGSEAPGYDDRGFARVTLPHTVAPLSWGNWDHASWEKVWIYRKHFDGSAVVGGRVFADFDGALANATVVVNGVTVSTHQGGYLPWSAELTGHLTSAGNVLAVIVDARLLNVPPDNPERGVGYTDYLQPGGIYRDVTLRAVPDVFISDVFAKPVSVLTPKRRVEVHATIDAATVPRGPVRVTAELLDGLHPIASASATATITARGTTTLKLTITGIGGVTLWAPDTPKLYTVRTTLSAIDAPSHTFEVTTGFREAVFQLDGFHLNGERFEIFGLNRHQLFPYLGMAASARLQRRDAEILRNELNCNMVRCSHYPQSPHFLDACDELGLMVWQEPPGWGYVGDDAFQQVVVQNVHDMVVRDRNRPSVIVWATRLNESASYPGLYAQTRRLAYELDGTRPTAGAVTFHSTTGWAEDVFSYDDYSSTAGNATLKPPVPGVPYLVSESVGAVDGAHRCRWTDPGAVLAEQGRMHAQVHNIAQSDARYAGLLAWCGFDYASMSGGDRVWRHLKTPGVVDTFRVPKPSAAFYRSQVSAQVSPVILPMFFWDFGPGSPARGPGPGAMIATNCDWLALYVDGAYVATAYPDNKNYGYLACPPAFADLTLDGHHRPELRIDGYVGQHLAVSVRMSADTTRDRLVLTADDTSIQADGSDTTRLTFRALDAYGNQRPHVTGDVTLSLAGPATLISQNPFAFGTYGGVGGAFVRSEPGRTGLVTVTAEHATLGHATARLTITPPRGQQFL